MKLKTVVLPLILINVIVFFIQQTVPSFNQMFVLSSADILTRPWILITSMFMHGGIGHLFFNMYALFLFGPLVESRIGANRLLFIYFIGGIIAGLGFTIFQEYIVGLSGLALGASGAIMAILGIVIMILPDLRVLFFFVIPMSMRTAGIIFALIDVFGLFHNTGIANSAHLAGLAAGLIYGVYLLKKRKEFRKNFHSRKSPKKTQKKVINVRNKNDIQLSDDQIDDYIKHGRI